MTTETYRYLSAGGNEYGQLCRDDNTLFPLEATGLKTENLEKISLGNFHCAAVYRDGSVFGWGSNFNGKIGNQFDKNVIKNNIIRRPTRIDNLPPIADAVCGNNFTLFLSKNKEVFISTTNKCRKELIEKVHSKGKCASIFGFKNPWFVCEDGTIYRITDIQNNSVKEMTKFELPFNAKSKKIKTILSLSNSSTELILTEAGEVFGIGEVANQSKEFIQIMSLENHKIIKVSGIGNHIVALSEEGKVFVWGKNNYGQLGSGNLSDQIDSFIPINFSFSKIDDISAGIDFSVFLESGGNIWATGSGCNMETLFGDHRSKVSPEKVNSIDKATAVFCGGNFLFIKISFLEVVQKLRPIENPTPQPLKTDELEMKYKNLKEKYQQLENEKIYTDKKLKILKKQKEEIEKKNKLLEKENEKLKEEICQLKEDLGVKLEDSCRFGNIVSLDDEALKNLKLVRKIGRGESSTVFEVVRNEKYALKIMESGKINDIGLKHFLREYEILNSLNNRNIIKAYGISFHCGKEFDQKSPTKNNEEEDENCFKPAILLEYCPRNLNIEEIEKMEKLEKIKVLYEIVNGMICIHSKEIIHRNLKPENILIDSRGRVKIGDFGISTIESNETKTKGVGTIKYMAPELLKDEDHYSMKVDNYAFGVLMHFILTNGEYPKLSQQQIIVGKKAKISDLICPISKGIINKCLSFSPDDRPSFIEIQREMKMSDFNLIPLSIEEKKEIKKIICNLKF